MKKLITSFLVLIATAIGSAGAYAYDFEVDGLYYNIVSLPDLTCSLTSGDNPYSGDIVIPATVTYKNRDLNVVSIAERAFDSNKGVTSVVIPNSVTEIGYNAFEGCTSLTSVEIPNSVTTIAGAFQGCTSLTSVEIPNSVTTIAGAFQGCTSLTSVDIPNSVTEIGYSAFSGCSSLTSVVIPNSVTTIGYGAFSGCTSLASVEIPNSVTEIGNSVFSGCTSLASVEIPNSVTEIGNSAFFNCTSLTSVIIPNSVKVIRFSTFYDCKSLVSVEIPNSVTEIGGLRLDDYMGEGGAFYGCSSLSSVKIPNSVKKIGIQAFRDCTSLTSVEIPNSVTEFEDCIFLNCENLTSVRFFGDEKNEPLSWNTFYYNTYSEKHSLVAPWKGCFKLTDLIIECELNPAEALSWFEGVQSTKWLYMFPTEFDDNGNWWVCPICNITFGCKTMPSWGINYWNELETITFTDAVEEIEAGALAGCSGLKAIYCQGMTPPQLGTGSFTNEQCLELPVYVPKGSLTAYQAAPEWCNFWELQEYDPEADGITDIQIEPANVAYDVYNMQGVCVKRAATADDINSLAPGLYIIAGKKVLVR